jgi:8-oxo-dGTP pyrophosphatase MutT (NUDIX family)
VTDASDASYVSLHADATSVLAGWQPPNREQDELRRAYLEFLATHDDAMSRTCSAGHLTASALIIDVEGERMLLTLHGKAGRWFQTGGHCEPGDTTIGRAALREAVEESGIDNLRLLPDPVRLDRHDVLCSAGQAEHLDVQYIAFAPPGAVEQRSVESLELAWFWLDQPPELTDDAVRGLAAYARRLLPA